MPLLMGEFTSLSLQSLLTLLISVSAEAQVVREYGTYLYIHSS